MNEMLITVKAEETMFIIRNVVVPSSRQKIARTRIYYFEIVNN